LADTNNSKMTTSDAKFRSFPNKLLTARWNEGLAQTSQNLKTWDLTIKTTKYLSSEYKWTRSTVGSLLQKQATAHDEEHQW